MIKKFKLLMCFLLVEMCPFGDEPGNRDCLTIKTFNDQRCDVERDPASFALCCETCEKLRGVLKKILIYS